MLCPKCQFDNREGVKFCEKCGANLELICPNCNSKIPFDRIFCGICGHNLTDSSEITSIDYPKLQSYTPKFLAEKILTTRSAIEGERKLVTVLFADVANYTSLSEKLDPEEVHKIMDGLFQILMDEIHKHEGTINQFTGDGVMALFGAPVAHEDHAQRACYAALSIQTAIGEYGDKITQDTGVEFKLRIGLNSGLVIVGAIGNDLRMDYTAIGDTTNLGSRMERMAKPGTILVSENTYRLVKDFFEFKVLGKLEIKGKEKPQEAYELFKAGLVETRIKASATKGLTKFTGRKNSMFALQETYKAMLSGSGQIVGVVGEAGVGKSRLLLEFINHLPLDQVIHLEGQCLHHGESIIYMPILEIVKKYFHIQEDDQEFAINKKLNEKISALDEKLLDIIPPLQDILSLKVANKIYVELKPREKREKTFEALRDLFLMISKKTPLVLIIEDLHWIDKTSEEFLDYLTGWVANTRIMLIILYRPEYAHQWGSKSYYTKVGLNQLSNVSSRELVQAILQEGEVLPELEQFLLNRSAGNPLFMEELTYSLIENGTIQKKDRRYVVDGKIFNIPVPDTIQGIIAGRMDRLEENLKRTMQVASVIGREFAFRVLQTISGMHEEIKAYLQKLQSLELIYEKTLFPELEYIFKHALTQEVAYNSVLLSRRKKIHENIGKAIEELYQHRLEEYYEMLAYHYSRSDNNDKAYHYLKLSGDKTRAGYANWEALRFYGEAIEVLDKMPPTEANKRERIEARLSMATPAMFLSYPGDTLNIIKAGVKMSREVGDERSLAKLDGTLAHAYAIKGEPSLSIGHAEKCFKRAQKIHDLDLMAPVARDLTSAYMFAGELQKAVPIFSTVIPLIERLDKRSESFGRPASVYTFLCGLAGLIMGFLGSFNEAKTLCEKAIGNARQNDNIYELAYSEFSYGVTAMQKGDGQLTIEHLQKCIDYLEQSQMATLMDPTLACLGLGHIYQRQLEKAKNFADQAIVAACKPEAASGNAILTQSVLAMVYSELGDLEKAHSCATEAVKISKERKVGTWEGSANFVYGLVLARMGKQRLEEAEECIDRALLILNEYGLKPWLANALITLGEIYARSGQIKKAIEASGKAREMFREMGMDYWSDRTQKFLARL